MSKSEEDYLLISKINAAKRQLEFAIINFFKDEDFVSIHTVATSSYQILLDIGKKKGIKSLLFDSDLILEKYRKEFRNSVRKSQNFFKHAERQGEEDVVLKFYPEQSTFLIFDAIFIYKELTNEVSPVSALFIGWMKCRYPEFINDTIFSSYKELFGKLHYSQKDKFLEMLPEIESACKIEYDSNLK